MALGRELAREIAADEKAAAARDRGAERYLRTVIRAEIKAVRDQARNARAGMRRNPDDQEWPVMAECYEEALEALQRVKTAAGL
jgi:hypothetical protein